jgi:hypothetical protein
MAVGAFLVLVKYFSEKKGKKWKILQL